ncbi:MAG: phage baseplate assembly protein V [Solibacillus sp.]
MFTKNEDDHVEPVRIGIVSSVNLKAGTARVFFPDRDESVSPELYVIQTNTLKQKSYWMPDVDEQVVCLFLSTGQETGFIVGSYYSEADAPVPEISQAGQKRCGLWIDEGNFIKWVEEERKFVVKSENPIDWLVGE